MRQLKTFESIFDFFKPKDNNNEIRISLDEQSFSDLCDDGFITHENIKLHVNKSKFADLIGGSIISVTNGSKHYKIALKDIGFNTILKYALDSEIYH